MPVPGQNNSQDTAPSGSSSTPYVLDHGAPIIMVEGRKHSVEDRRRVRAQAARASAAASRETRQRNRGDQTSRQASNSRPETSSQPTQSGPVDSDAAALRRADLVRATTAGATSSVQTSSSVPTNVQSASEATPTPLMIWLHEWLQSSPISQEGTMVGDASQGRAGTMESTPLAGQALYELVSRSERDDARFELPIAVPRGFAELQRSGAMSEAFVVLVGRTACFNFGGPGAKRRLQTLLRDVIMSAEQLAHPRTAQRTHQYIRIACVCLTIYQSQRASGQEFAQGRRYQIGLDAAWQEAIVLDPGDFRDASIAQVLLWAVTTISLTCGALSGPFNPLLRMLCEYLQLKSWEALRQLLSTFIYPASFLDASCRQFFEELTRS